VERAILLVVGDNTFAFATFHDQIQRKVLDKIVGVVMERLAVERMKERVTSSVGSGAASVCLSTLSILLRLTAKSSLVYPAVFRSRERASVSFEFDNRSGGFAGHVMDRILVT